MISQDDMKVIAASAHKIIDDIREAAMGRGRIKTLHTDVSIEAATILKLIEPHLNNKVVRLGRADL